jgi:hypothetical protein
MSAVPVILAALSKASPAVDVLGLALNSTLNEALSPSAGLSVTPLVFNSVEQEGRWKIKDWGFNELRDLTNSVMFAHGKQSLLSNPANAPVSCYPARIGAVGGSATHREFANLLTITVDPPSASSGAIASLLNFVGPPGAASSLYELAKLTILQKGQAVIGAEWQHDDLEIWGGFAGLTSATGFGSVFGHRANVQLLGTVYGNYLPGAYMVAMSGWVNPVGTKYVEFRCAVVIQAGKPVQPLFGQQWTRDAGDTPTPLNFSSDAGYQLHLIP